MVTEIRIPSIGFSEGEGRLTEWHVADGQHVEQGQRLYSLELEKAIEEIEAPVAGIIRIVVAASESYSPGALVATIG